MARLLLFFILLAPMVLAGDWLLGHPGIVVVDWLGYQIEMHVALLALALLLACFTVAALVLALWQVTGWPQRRRARRRYRTMARGLTHITHGITALALGDEKAAGLALRKAMETLPGEPLPQLLTAQLMQRQGRHEAARSHLRALLRHASTAQLASKRLIEQHSEHGEWDAAAELAEQLFRDTPRERWLVLTLLDLYARRGNARGMLQLTEGFQWKSPLDRAERDHYAARAYYLQSLDAPTERAQRTALRHAVGFAPDFLPALLAYAQLLIHNGEVRQARKWLLTAWLARPRSILIPAILHSIEEASPRAQARLLHPFLKNGAAAEHALLRAQHALMLGDTAAAEAALEESISIQETRESCSLMAEAEKLLRGDEAANRWLARAMRAPAGEGWICEACGAPHAGWQAHCKNCDTFDSIAYARPEARITSVELATA